MTIFTYILRGLKRPRRPKWLVLPFVLSWKPKRRVYRARRMLSARLWRRRLYPLPVVAPSGLTWKWPWFRLVRKPQRRPLWRFSQRRLSLRLYPLPVVKPSSLTWKWPWFRLVRKTQKRPLWRFFARRLSLRRYPLPIVAPSSLTWRKVRRFRFQRRLRRSARRLYPFVPVAAPPAALAWKRPVRPSIKVRSRLRIPPCVREKSYPIDPPLPANFGITGYSTYFVSRRTMVMVGQRRAYPFAPAGAGGPQPIQYRHFLTGFGMLGGFDRQ